MKPSYLTIVLQVLTEYQRFVIFLTPLSQCSAETRFEPKFSRSSPWLLPHQHQRTAGCPSAVGVRSASKTTFPASSDQTQAAGSRCGRPQWAHSSSHQLNSLSGDTGFRNFIFILPKVKLALSSRSWIVINTLLMKTSSSSPQRQPRSRFCTFFPCLPFTCPKTRLRSPSAAFPHRLLGGLMKEDAAFLKPCLLPSSTQCCYHSCLS